jgi:hypothetical protein
MKVFLSTDMDRLAIYRALRSAVLLTRSIAEAA